MGMSTYLTSLRQQVGHQLLLLPAVTVLVLDDDGRVLLVKQTDNEQWNTIGGMVEPDESPATAAVREAREEAGIEVELVRILDAVGGAGFRASYPNGDEVAYVSIVYEARLLSGVLQPDHDETIDAAFFTHDEIESVDISPFATAILSAVDWPSLHRTQESD